MTDIVIPSGREESVPTHLGLLSTPITFEPPHKIR